MFVLGFTINRLLVLLLSVLFSSMVNAELRKLTTVTVLGPQPGDNDRNAYQEALIRIALDHTQAEYGSYKIVYIKKRATVPRSRMILAENSVENYVRSFVFDKDLAEDEALAYIPFPIYLGLLSYRVCFTSQEKLAGLQKVQDLKALLPYKHVMGEGWSDVDILRHNGFRVTVSGNYTSLFRMLSLGRADLFCRGVHEVQNEYEGTRHIQNLALVPNLAIHYPLPLYFFSGRQNKVLLDRIEKGIMAAYQDGSLMRLWHKYFLQAIAFSKMSSRRVIYLENNGLMGLEDKYSSYFYKLDTTLEW